MAAVCRVDGSSYTLRIFLSRVRQHRRRLARALLALALYAYALLVVPAAHAAHHARFGDDHRHTDAGVVALETTAETVHAEQHATFEALGLADVASAGVELRAEATSLAPPSGTLPRHSFGAQTRCRTRTTHAGYR